MTSQNQNQNQNQASFKDSDIISCFDAPHYAKLAVDNREAYKNNEPYPHMVFDQELIRKVEWLPQAELLHFLEHKFRN